jgi:pimeloyl-ACP methyl ester carboxylesterase
MHRAILLSLVVGCPLFAAEGPQPPELKDGDIVALIGGGFIEREGQYGYIETALTARYADRDIRFRNLGWSGDTVWCESRAYFGTPEDGFKHLLEHVDLVKPTVIILNYGANEAFAGEAGLPKFIDGYNRLLDELGKRTKRIALLSPTPLEPVFSDWGPIVEPQVDRQSYVLAIKDIAERRNYSFVDLYGRFRSLQFEGLNLTDDGLYPNEQGWVVAWLEIVAAFTGGVPELLTPENLQRVGKTFDHSFEALRRGIVEKNALFFHRHRPQNETYLRGFRKHEQGNNAVEIFEFEKLVEEKEKEIARLRGELLKALQAKEGGK